MHSSVVFPIQVGKKYVLFVKEIETFMNEEQQRASNILEQ